MSESTWIPSLVDLPVSEDAKEDGAGVATQVFPINLGKAPLFLADWYDAPWNRLGSIRAEYL